jgi:N-acetylmuramoyl-L-alanine amidase
VREVNGRVLVSRVDLVKTLEPILRPTRIRNAQAFRTVIIDAGHGGTDNGARSPYSMDEKRLTLDLAWRIKLLLEARGYRTVMTRSNDEFIPLERRAVIADSTSDSIFVSIHFNAGDRHAAGVETYCLSPRGAPSTNTGHPSLGDYVPTAGEFTDAPSLLLAHCVQRRMGNMRRMDAERRGVKRARFVVLKETTRPSILVEGGFLTNPDDARLVNDPQHRQTLAREICAGITDYRALLLTGRLPELTPLPIPREAPPVTGGTPQPAAASLSLAAKSTNQSSPVLSLVADWQQRPGAVTNTAPATNQTPGTGAAPSAPATAAP